MRRETFTLSDADLEKETVRYYTENPDVFLADIAPFPPELVESVESYLRHLALNPLILDIGCGNGRAYEPLTELGCRYIGVEPAGSLLEIARTNHPRADFRAGSVADLSSLVTEECDAFIACASLNHVPRSHMKTALASIRSVVKNGAVGWVTTPILDEEHVVTFLDSECIPEGYAVYMSGYSEESIGPYVAEAGFRLVETFQPDDWANVFVLLAV